MINLVGTILNMTAAAVLFPVLLLPLASLASTRMGAKGVLVWLAMVIGVILVCIAFAILAPRLWSPEQGIGAALTNSLLLFAPALSLLTAVIARTGGPGVAVSSLVGPLEKIIRLTGRATLMLIYAMALIQFTVVILRYVFGLNFIAMQESVTYLHGAVFLLAAGYALLTNDHVRVDIFYSQMPERRRAMIDLAGTYLFLFPFCLVLLWSAGPYVGNSWDALEGSAEQSGIQAIFLLKSLIPIYGVLLLAAGFVLAARAAETLRSRSNVSTTASEAQS